MIEISDDKMRRFFLFLVFLLLGLDVSTASNVYTLLGRVLDESGTPLIGACVKTVGHTNNATTTDDQGFFSLKVSDHSSSHIEVSFIGYKTETFILKVGQERHTIKLTPDVSALQQVVVTGTRTPKVLKDVPIVTRVITADDIRKADATNIQDLLKEELPGLEFGYAMSQETSLTMNGLGGNAVLFLVDGERLAGETMDNVDYNRLNLDNVGRIEIVKGAASALYGANAVSGVVNIISRESKEPWTANINTRYNEAGKEWRHGGSFSFNLGKFNSQTNIQRTTSETIKLTDAFDTKSNIQQVWGGETFNLKERLVYQATKQLKLIAKGSYFERESNRSNYDDRYDGYNGGLKGLYDWGKGQNLEFSYAYDQYDKSRYVSGVRTHDHDYSNRQHIVRALYNLPVSNHTLTVGADYMNDYLTTYQFLNNEAKSQQSADVFAQFDYNPFTWLNVLASLRYDYFSESKSNATTARLATMFKWNGYSIRASYAGGFRAPSLKEMYMYFDMAGILMIYGNPDLKPEKSNNFNIAFEHYGKVKGVLDGHYSMTLMGYCNQFDKRITTVDFKGDSEREAGAMYWNEEGVTLTGVDLSAQYRSTMGLGAKINYSYLHIKGNSMESQFTQPRPHSVTFRVDYDKQICAAYGFSVAISGRYLGKPQTKEKTNGAYSMWKFTLQQRIWKGLNLNVMIDNLLGYKPDVYYWNSAPTIGRTYLIGLSVDIDKIFKGKVM